jgi:hypothetical protein
MATKTKVAELLKSTASILRGEGSYTELASVCAQLPLEEAFQWCREGMSKLSEMERFDVWHHANGKQDRLAAILSVAELRMPPHKLGPLTLTMSDTLSDYDRARTFILQNRTSGPFIPNFYPEVTKLPVREKILTLALSHVGCTPKGQRQTNLFALCGFNDYEFARATTTPHGTTCALFMRAVLKAAGDSRLTPDMLPLKQTDMHKAMGVVTPIVKSLVPVPPFRSGLITKERLPTPRPGDLYHTQIPATALYGDASKQDSGHVGFVRSAARTQENVLDLETIDGGIVGAGGGQGFWTVAGRLQLVRGNKGFWTVGNKDLVMGEARILVGYVDLDQVASAFVSDKSYSLDGCYIDTQYPG